MNIEKPVIDIFSLKTYVNENFKEIDNKVSEKANKNKSRYE